MPKKGENNYKMTDEAVRKLEEAFAIDATVGEACFYAEISRDTYYRWIKENPDLSDKFERLREKPILKARQTVVNALDSPKDAQWYLERKRKREFAQRVEQTGEDGEPRKIKIEIVKPNGKPETENEGDSSSREES